jgi:hypothetical protein
LRDRTARSDIGALALGVTLTLDDGRLVLPAEFVACAEHE